MNPNLLPDNHKISDSGELLVAGCSLLELAKEYGTPLFVYDEDHIRDRCRQAVAAFPDGVAYAAKAFFLFEYGKVDYRRRNEHRCVHRRGDVCSTFFRSFA